MQIIILGAGQVGTTLAENLASESNDITVVDTDLGRLRALQDRLDLRTVYGHACHPSVLRDAGAQEANMLVAVTSSDEVNMVACQVAHSLFKTPNKIARVRNHDYLFDKESIFSDKGVPVDVLISPEQLVTRHITQLMQHPGALQVLDFAHGAARLVAAKTDSNAPMCGRPVADLVKLVPGIEVRIVAIFRRGTPLRPEGDTVIEPDDEVFFITAREQVSPVMQTLRRIGDAYRQVMIAGGGNIGAALAGVLEFRLQVKVIERSAERCNELRTLFSRALVINSGASEQQVLLEEGIAEMDLFCALTNDDEANIMSSMLAKRLGARTVMALINNPAYVDLVGSGGIDLAISPQQATTGSLLTLVRRGEVVNVHTLRHGAAEALEAVARGSRHRSQVVGRSIGEIRFPSGATVGVIVREGRVLSARHDLVVQDGDHLILFLTDKRAIPIVERLFQTESD